MFCGNALGVTVSGTCRVRAEPELRGLLAQGVAAESHAQVAERGVAGDPERVQQAHLAAGPAGLPVVVGQGDRRLRQRELGGARDERVRVVAAGGECRRAGDELERRARRVEPAGDGPVVQWPVRVGEQPLVGPFRLRAGVGRQRVRVVRRGADHGEYRARLRVEGDDGALLIAERLGGRLLHRGVHGELDRRPLGLPPRQQIRDAPVEELVGGAVEIGVRGRLDAGRRSEDRAVVPRHVREQRPGGVGPEVLVEVVDGLGRRQHRVARDDRPALPAVLLVDRAGVAGVRVERGRLDELDAGRAREQREEQHGDDRREPAQGRVHAATTSGTSRGGGGHALRRPARAVGDAQQQRDHDPVGHERRPAVGEERRGQAGQRDQPGDAADDDEHLQRHRERQAGGEQLAEAVPDADARCAGRARTSIP